MWNFITFHLRRMRENQGTAQVSSASAPVRKGKTMQEKAKERKEKKPKKGADADESDLPEVDQDTKTTLRQRR